MIEQILTLRSKGLSFRKIAKELNSTVGKVQYQWKKYMSDQKEELLLVQAEEKMEAIPNTTDITNNFWTSIDYITKNNGMEAWLLAEDATLVLWRIPEGKWQLISTYYTIDKSECSLAVKINDITSIIYNGKNAHSSRFIPVNLEQDSLFIEKLLPNRSYCFEIGVIDVYQSFLPILQSNPLQTPRTSIEQVGNMEQDMKNWENNHTTVPNWIEHVSTYSYYELEEHEDVKKK
ncbi:DUF4912 domain-containing protein [Bacillus sp. B1-b2]|uniref:DUF4912 domain-containing protein n=1 Tax=Bacillus sp. B1-b2 TaxID=2653201 RepID=UPI001262A647|nr:DUF4912 domain-containing protein [Bacillus sp. B1-b2]KAB7670037.1 DUF4912 domain-containing protein [Bacillus sp. B1-b2]